MAQLIYLMGASGSGKDSLLAALRADVDSAPLVAHRYITRPADAGCENHIALSEREFLRRRAKGLFALDWQAHQQHYALGIEVDLWLLQGIDVVVNGSRAHLSQAQQRYGAQLLPVCLQVSTDILRQRLQNRARENADQIEQRLARAAEYQLTLPAGCRLLDNDGNLDDTLAALLALLPASAKQPQDAMP